MRIAVVGDSISTRGNGASATSWPELFDSMIRSMGVFDIEIRNYSIPGLRWITAHVATPGWLIGGVASPLDAVKRDGCDMLIVCMGVNDRQNASALQDAQDFKATLPDVPVYWVRQNMFDSNLENDSVVTEPEQARMNAVYESIAGDGFYVSLGKLYDMGYSYDMLHPTNSGKQWIASAVYIYFHQILKLTPITRNIAWLWNQTQAVRDQMRKAQT